MGKQPDKDTEKPSRPFNYLALGDSYTIGEGVDTAESFPHQLVAMLNGYGLNFRPPAVIARTGWTAKELQGGIEEALFSDKKYDLVTVLIGVNNQYREDSAETFQVELAPILDQAIDFADGDPSRIIVMSIPDWGVTSFAVEGRVPVEKVAEEIDLFNQVIEKVSKQKKVHFLEITQEYRHIGGHSKNLVADKLHPSGAIYKKWAKQLSQLILSQFDFGKVVRLSGS